MQINRNGFVFRSAYAFVDREEWPTRVSGCDLFWRFLWCGFWRAVMNVLVIIVTIVLALTALPIRFLFALSRGRTLKRRDPAVGERRTTLAWRWVDKYADKIFIGSFYSEEIERWPEVAGWRILPLPILIGCAVVAVEYWLISVGGSKFFSIAYLYTDNIFSFATLVLHAEFVALCLIILLIVSDTELGKVIAMRAKAFKDRTCPIVEVV